MNDKDLLTVLAEVYGTVAANEDVAWKVPTVTVIETDTAYVDGKPVRIYSMKQEPLLCGDAPIIPFEDTF